MRDGNVRVQPCASVDEPVQFGSACCHGGIASKALQPLPVLDHALSLQPRATVASCHSSVPPTATTLGTAADTSSRSSAVSICQPAKSGGATGGSGAALPFWFTLRKQRFAVVHGGKPYRARYTARSCSACGVSYASTIAISASLPLLRAAAVR